MKPSSSEVSVGAVGCMESSSSRVSHGAMGCMESSSSKFSVGAMGCMESTSSKVSVGAMGCMESSSSKVSVGAVGCIMMAAAATTSLFQLRISILIQRNVNPCLNLIDACVAIECRNRSNVDDVTVIYNGTQSRCSCSEYVPTYPKRYCIDGGTQKTNHCFHLHFVFEAFSDGVDRVVDCLDVGFEALNSLGVRFHGFHQVDKTTIVLPKYAVKTVPLSALRYAAKKPRRCRIVLLSDL
ncbi:hypothetical protein ACHAXS_007028 [Conticribra weissflogii]